MIAPDVVTPRDDNDDCDYDNNDNTAVAVAFCRTVVVDVGLLLD